MRTFVLRLTLAAGIAMGSCGAAAAAESGLARWLGDLFDPPADAAKSGPPVLERAGPFRVRCLEDDGRPVTYEPVYRVVRADGAGSRTLYEMDDGLVFRGRADDHVTCVWEDANRPPGSDAPGPAPVKRAAAPKAPAPPAPSNAVKSAAAMVPPTPPRRPAWAPTPAPAPAETGVAVRAVPRPPVAVAALASPEAADRVQTAETPALAEPWLRRPIVLSGTIMAPPQAVEAPSPAAATVPASEHHPGG